MDPSAAVAVAEGVSASVLTGAIVAAFAAGIGANVMHVQFVYKKLREADERAGAAEKQRDALQELRVSEMRAVQETRVAEMRTVLAHIADLGDFTDALGEVVAQNRGPRPDTRRLRP